MDKEWFQGRTPDEQHQRAYFRRVGIVIVAAVILGLATAGAIRKAYAAEPIVYSDGKGNTITLTEEPCTTTEGFFADMPANMRPHFKAASTHWQGTDYISCWMLREDGKHFVVDQTGDYGVLEGTAFKRLGADA